MKGSIGTSTHITVIKDPRKKFKKGKKGRYFCTKCRRMIRKDEWVSPQARLTYKHTYPSECQKTTVSQ